MPPGMLSGMTVAQRPDHTRAVSDPQAQRTPSRERYGTSRSKRVLQCVQW